MRNPSASITKIVGLLLLALMTSFGSRASATAVPVVNGGFDDFTNVENQDGTPASAPFSLNGDAGGYLYGTLGQASSYTYGGGASGPYQATSVAGFTYVSLVQYEGFADVVDFGSNYVGAGTSDGVFADLEQATMSETLTSNLQVNSEYSLSFAAAYRADQYNPGSYFTVELLAGSTPLAELTGRDSPDLTTTFQNFTFVYDDATVSPSLIGQPLTISFTNNLPNGIGSHQAFVDNVSLDVEGVVVPEPSTYAFLILGLGALLTVVRFRQVS